jgi:hypothetical protein
VREEHLPDLPFDAQADEGVLVLRLETVHGLPSHELRVRLMAVGDRGEHEIGRCAFRHRVAP